MNLRELEFTDKSTLQLLEEAGITTIEQLEAKTREDLLALDLSYAHFDPLDFEGLRRALENADIELPQLSDAEAA
ncbi:MAG TPA: hypothetical protein VMR46_04075 [Candidatus Paceibacterota bacterium]|nr:hypothetical protein [Candidatus Paceibacterota bacterium]